jgi:YesN/AraC family two-component response regulator
MKAKLEQINIIKNEQSFLCYKRQEPAFEMYWHYHPEFELTYIMEGEGRRIVGDNHASFVAGDLVLLGTQLPHTWVAEKRIDADCQAIVIQFSPTFIAPLLAYSELKAIKNLLEKAQNGLFFPKLEKEILDKIIDLVNQVGVYKITNLLEILAKLSEIEAKTLSSPTFQVIENKNNEKRINQIFQYIQDNFTQTTLSVENAAKQIHLTKGAFCKFFKNTCGKTFSDYVNDIRVAHACNLLFNSDKAISLVAIESGFENLAYFNRVFLKKKGVVPTKFRAENV